MAGKALDNEVVYQMYSSRKKPKMCISVPPDMYGGHITSSLEAAQCWEKI